MSRFHFRLVRPFRAIIRNPDGAIDCMFECDSLRVLNRMVRANVSSGQYVQWERV
jgi:hypothetical protein